MVVYLRGCFFFNFLWMNDVIISFFLRVDCIMWLIFFIKLILIVIVFWLFIVSLMWISWICNVRFCFVFLSWWIIIVRFFFLVDFCVIWCLKVFKVLCFLFMDCMCFIRDLIILWICWRIVCRVGVFWRVVWFFMSLMMYFVFFVLVLVL